MVRRYSSAAGMGCVADRVEKKKRQATFGLRSWKTETTAAGPTNELEKFNIDYYVSATVAAGEAAALPPSVSSVSG